MNTPDPRSIAHVLGVEVLGRVLLAKRYLDDWRILLAAGVPVDDIRHALDRKVQETIPTRRIGEWNGKGLLGLTGAADSGKSFAAVRWLLEQLRSGRPSVWVSSAELYSFEDLDAAAIRANRAYAVVIDDLGVGLTTVAGCSAKIHGLIMARGQRPTVLTSNADEAGLREYVGARIISRLSQAGDLVWIEAEAGLREPDAEPLDADGHGSWWQRATWLVKTFGLEHDELGVRDPKTSKVTWTWRAGGQLANDLARMGDRGAQVAGLELLARRMGIDWTRLLDLARADEETMTARLGDMLGQVRALESKLGEHAAKVSDIIDLADRDIKADKARAKLRASVEPLGRSPGIPKEPATWLDGEGQEYRPTRSQLKSAGFKVLAGPGGYRVTYRDSVILFGIPGHDGAWDDAARMAGGFSCSLCGSRSECVHDRAEAAS